MRSVRGSAPSGRHRHVGVPSSRAWRATGDLTHLRGIPSPTPGSPPLPRGSQPLLAPPGLDVAPQSQVLADLLPADLEDRPPLAEMEVLQRHRLHQLREIELGQL